MVRAKVVTVMRWCAWWGEPRGEWTAWGWRNKEGSWFHRWGVATTDDGHNTEAYRRDCYTGLRSAIN